MKKFFIILMVAFVGISLTGCKYDDEPLWSELEQIKDRVKTLEEAVKSANGNIAALQTLVDALQKNVYVTAVNSTDNGYTIVFSDGKSATITNGLNAPAISVKEDTDGNYYWTLDGEWMLVNEKKVRANASAPELRINDTTKEWEISNDGGKTWVLTNIVAEGKDGDAFFKSVDTSNADYVTVTLADGKSEFKLARYDETAPQFIIVDAPKVAQIKYGESMELKVNVKNVADYVINTPQCWKASYVDGTLTITAPEKDLCHFEKKGTLSIAAVSASGKTTIVKLNVATGEEWVDKIVLRTLTFEDADANFESYELYGGALISTWSDLVDDQQYGGSLTYTDYMSDEYWWYDEGNTELFHSFTTPYWGGGHVISNYRLENYSTLPGGYYGWYELQMSTPLGGHNGSANFAVHNGYSDFFNSQIYDASLKGFEFADGVERVVDHMYVTNTNYVLNSLTYGDGFNSAATADTYFKIVAYGYNANDEQVGSVEFSLCNGANNILKTWAKWDLSSLGKVAKIVFNFKASDDQSGEYGLNCPAYFAYDDVAVQFVEKVLE